LESGLNCKIKDYLLNTEKNIMQLMIEERVEGWGNSKQGPPHLSSLSHAPARRPGLGVAAGSISPSLLIRNWNNN
jgi:hypothetical protein